MKHLIPVLAILFILPSCTKKKEKKPFEEAYTPKEYKIRRDKTHPINPKVRYYSTCSSFNLKMLDEDKEYYVVYNKNNSVSTELMHNQKDGITFWARMKNKAGVQNIFNFKNGENCYSFTGPYCTIYELNEANKLFLEILQKTEFNKHLKYFLDNKKQNNNLNG